MRKRALSPGVLILVTMALFLSACQKEVSQNTIYNSNKEIITKVNEWLDSKKPADKLTQAANVELLRENLDFLKLRIEKSDANEQIVIIPIKEVLKKEKNLDKNSIPNLVLILNSSGNIRKGNIVLYTPDSGHADKVPDNTFYAIMNTGTPDCDGKFKFLTATGKFAYQLEYKNKNLASVALPKPRTESGAGANRETTFCVDWYIVTTYYDEYGLQTDVTEEYLGTTCQGENCEDPYREMLCSMDSSSGGGLGDDSEYEYEQARDRAWHVYNTSGGPLETTGHGTGVNSVERFRGKRNSSESQGGHFTSISHLSSECNSGCMYGQNGYGEDSWEGSASGQSASSHVTGHYPRPSNGTTVYVENTKSWSFETIFP